LLSRRQVLASELSHYSRTSYSKATPSGFYLPRQKPVL
jgi:hypothetical protein